MRINALPPYVPNYQTARNNNDTKNKPHFTSAKTPQNLKHNLGSVAAFAGFLSIPFLFCAIAKKMLKPKDEHHHIFLNDGTYFAYTKDFYKY